MGYSAAARAASSRRACASRGVTSGYSGSVPTSGGDLPGAGAFASLREGEHDADAGHVVQAEGIRGGVVRAQRQIARDAGFRQIHALEGDRRSGSVTWRMGAASSEEPMRLAARSTSSGRGRRGALDAPAAMVRQRIIAPLGRGLGEGQQMHRAFRSAGAGKIGLLAGEAEDGREPGDEAVKTSSNTVRQARRVTEEIGSQ